MSQVTIGLGFPKAEQVMVTLPPSLASIYWGGVSVKVGGAAERAVIQLSTHGTPWRGDRRTPGVPCKELL